MAAPKDNQQKLRFVAVGVINTALDFGIFLALSNTLLSAVAANYISTTTALAFSYYANKKYTFASSGKSLKKEIGLFLIFTLFGLWVLQPLIILGVQHAASSMHMSHLLRLAASKILATIVTLIWNYTTYNRFVFKIND